MSRALRIQIWKEVRALLPWWAAIVFTLGVCSSIRVDEALRRQTFVVLTLLAYVAGTASLGALSFGHEYSNRTFGTLLTFPRSRLSTLAIKLGVLAILLAAVVAVAWFPLSHVFPPYRGREFQYALMFGAVLGAFFVAPALSMLTRSALAAAVFTVAIPLLMLMLSPVFRILPSDLWRIWLGIVSVGAVVTVVGIFRLPVIEGPGRALSLPGWLRRPMADPEPRTHVTWLGALVRKELRLQVASFTVAAVFIAMWLAILVGQQVDGSIGPLIYAVTFLYIGVVALLAGSLAVAEERQHGAAGWHLLLPVPGWKQWMLKSGIALAVGLVLGVLVPLAIGLVHNSSAYVEINQAGVYAVALLTIAGLYFSSVSTSGLKALLAALPAVASVIFFGQSMLIMVVSPLSALLGPVARAWISPRTWNVDTVRMIERLLPVPAVAGLVVILLVLAYRNFRSGDYSRRRVLGQIAGMAAYSVGAIVILTAVEALLSAGVRLWATQ
jgi:hypothetical protein